MIFNVFGGKIKKIYPTIFPGKKSLNTKNWPKNYDIDEKTIKGEKEKIDIQKFNMTIKGKT